MGRDKNCRTEPLTHLDQRRVVDREIMAWIQRRLTYANVMATLAVFVALGGSATAAGVFRGRPQASHVLSKAEVSKKKAKKRRGPQGKTGAQGPAGTKGDKGDSGGKGDTGTPGSAGAAATSLWAVVNPSFCSPNCSPARSKGVSSVTKSGTGVYAVDFNQAVSSCAAIATIGQTEGGSQVAGGQISVLMFSSSSVIVYTYDKTGAAEDRWFHLGVFC